MKALYKKMLLILLLFVAVTVVSGIFIYRTYANLNEAIVRRTALLLGRAVEDALSNSADKNLESLTASEKKRLRTLMHSMAGQKGSIIHILLINSKMKILLSSDRSVEGQTYKSPQELQKFTGREPAVLHKTWPGDVKVLDVIIPLQNSAGEVFGYLRLVLSHKALFNIYKDLSYIFIPIVLLFGLLLALSFYLASRAYQAPLESVKEMVSSLNKGDYSYRIQYSQRDEFTDTFSQLNKTIEKVGVLNESYKKARKRISTMLKAVDESLVMLDKEGRVLIYNDRAAELFACPADSDFADYFTKIFHHNRELRYYLQRRLEAKAPVENKEISVWLPDGRDLLLGVQSQIFKEENKVSGILISFKDVRMLNELQNNLQRSMKFGVIAQLASSISHEIKNPLSAMAIHAEVLNNRLRKMEAPGGDKLQNSLDVLQNEIKRLNRIIHQFFTLARSPRSDLSLININPVISDVLFLVQQESIERNIRLEKQLADNLDFIYGDPDQLKQVLLNLLLNAFHAIDKDGLVLVRSKQEHNRILVEIQDNGCGMSAEVQKKIFALYFTTKKDGGGIGLAVSKRIVEAHEGRITFESVEGQGTRFVLDFPRKDKTTQTNIPALRKS